MLQEITRLLVNISLRKGKDEQVVKVFKTLFEGYTAKYSDFVYTFLGHFYSAIKKAKISEALNHSLCDYLSLKAVPQMVGKSEKYCKVTETLLQLLYRLAKSSSKPLNEDFAQIQLHLLTSYPTNPTILSHILKLLALQATAYKSVLKIVEPMIA